jgi:hypothetical protein
MELLRSKPGATKLFHARLCIARLKILAVRIYHLSHVIPTSLLQRVCQTIVHVYDILRIDMFDL